ncbi:DUF4214 domain-containing protein [Aquihabitans sp. McL0605]|uniref:DUF4214 domain-containing protein n=1 Tax=Aquihabitans sp. McL0605 TaxID=3415671 RepID=UPI003CF48299
MPALPLRRTTLMALVVAGCLAVSLTPTPASAATDCAHDWVPTPPSNDNKANPKDFGGPIFSTSGHTCWATKEAGEAAHAGQPAAKSVWLTMDTFEAYTQRIDVYTAGSDFDTRLAVYSETGALVAANDDATSSNRTSKVSWLQTRVRDDYRVAIDGYTNASSVTADGTYIISYSLPLVAFTSTTHLTRATMKIYADRAPTSAEISKTVDEYRNGHYFQPGFIMVHRASASISEAMPVARLYTAVFNRLPDPSGLAYWIKKLRTGASLNTIAANMTTSSEFKNTYGSLGNGQFVDLVYNNVLKRAPDSNGRTYWVSKLDGGFKRSAMMAQFSESNEFVTKSANLMFTAIIWRLGHGSKNDAQLKAMIDGGGAQFNSVDSFGLLLEDAGFKSYVAGL